MRDEHIWGLGISNMKGALACYVEAVRAISDAGLRLQGDIVIAAVVGEIEKAQWGEEFRGARVPRLRRRQPLPAHPRRHRRHVHPRRADRAAVVLGHYGTMWARISTQGPFVHTAFTAGRLAENAIVRMQQVLSDVLAWIPAWERRSAYGGIDGVVNVGALRAGQPWRVSRTPNQADLFLDIRVPPTMPMTAARAEFAALVRELRERYPDFGIGSEVFVSAPGAQIDAGHPLIAAIDAGHAQVFGEPPARDTVRWFSDASALTRYGIETVNYGTSSGLPDPDGENLAIAGLCDIAKVYALVAADICGVAT